MYRKEKTTAPAVGLSNFTRGSKRKPKGNPVAITTLKKPRVMRGFVFSEVLKAQAFINEGNTK